MREVDTSGQLWAVGLRFADLIGCKTDAIFLDQSEESKTIPMQSQITFNIKVKTTPLRKYN